MRTGAVVRGFAVVRGLAVVGLIVLLAAPGGAQTAVPSPAASQSGQGAGAAAPAAGLGRLRADRVRYLAREQVYIATGNVSLTMGDLQIRADTLRYEQGPQVATAEGRVVVTRRQMTLSAPALRFEIRTEIAEASGGAVLAQQGTTVRAPRMRFVLQEEVTIASGGVEVVHGDATVTAPNLRHDGRTGEVTAEGGVMLVQPGSKMTGRRLVANLPARRADMREDVTLVRSPASAPQGRASPAPGVQSEETTVTAARIVFRWDSNEGEAMENVIVRQRDRTAWADRATYSDPANQLTLTGRVVLEQLSGESLVREGVLSTPRSAEERQALASVTRLTCTRLVMALRERDVAVEGPLRVTQKDRWATGDRGTYTEATRRLVVAGNVRMQESDGRRLQADRVVISLIEETFEAEGNVETQFVIRPSPTRRP